jgi:hypothetical protein
LSTAENFRSALREGAEFRTESEKMKGKHNASENSSVEPTDEQLFALLEDLQRQGHNLDELSPDLSVSSI